MTDQEVCCTFMEAMPLGSPGEYEGKSRQPKWWMPSELCGGEWQPIPLTLDACHEIEARLSGEQWGAYGLTLAEAMQAPERHFARKLIHATAEQKVKALAQVLRPIVEANNAL